MNAHLNQEGMNSVACSYKVKATRACMLQQLMCTESLACLVYTVYIKTCSRGSAEQPYNRHSGIGNGFTGLHNRPIHPGAVACNGLFVGKGVGQVTYALYRNHSLYVTTRLTSLRNCSTLSMNTIEIAFASESLSNVLRSGRHEGSKSAGTCGQHIPCWLTNRRAPWPCFCI